MSLFMNKATRTTAATVMSALALAGAAFAAFQSGNDVGAYCVSTAQQGETRSTFNQCCNGGCGGLHPVDTGSAGWTDCMYKCEAYFVSS